MGSNYILQATYGESVYSPIGKELGMVLNVVVEPSANITDKNLRAIYPLSQNQPVRLYDVRLVTRGTIFYGVPAFLGKNDVTVFEEGDMVLIDYLASPPTRMPFIYASVELSPKNQTAIGNIPPVSSGERYIQTSINNSVHLRNDGGVVITGGYNLPAPDGTNDGTYDNPFFFIIGGFQGVSSETGNPVRITLQDKLGPVFQVDNMGTLVFTRGSVETYASISEEHIMNNKSITVGAASTSDTGRIGTYSIAVGKTGTETFGEGLSITVGKSGGTANQNASFNLEVANQAIIDAHNGKSKLTIGSDGKIIVSADNVLIGGTDASEPLVMGYKLLTWLAQLYAWGTAVGGIVGLPPASAGCSLPDNTLLSQKNTTD